MDRGARLGTRYDRALRALGWLAFAGILSCALHDASQAFDGWYYHLKFAGRLVGMLPESSLVFHHENQDRYAGFALLAEVFQGLLWKLTGRAESANLVAFVSVPLVAWFMQRRWKVPAPVTMLALFAIPLVHTHAASLYVDLPGNAAASVLVLLVIDAYASDEPLPPFDVVLALATGAIAANIKPMLQPTVGLSLLAILVRAARDPRTRRLALAMVLASPLVLFTPLRNAIVHHNPFFPIGTHLLGVDLPGPQEPYSYAPAWLEHAPRPLRFLASLLEIGLRPLRDPRRWTVDQWMPEASGANRLGGFFNAYVVVLLVVFVTRVARGTSRLERVSGVVFALFTGLISVMPQSHELRYYMSWMIVLVCLDLGLACRTAARPFTPGLRTLGTLAALSFMVVVASTRAAYVLPRGLTVKELVEAKVDEGRLGEVKDGERICVRRPPFNMLWTDVFHAPRHYTVVEAENPEDCGDVRDVDSLGHP